MLSLPDNRLLYLVAVLRDTPVTAPALSPEEWREILDQLRPHGVYPLLAYRLRSWPEDCRPPAEVTDYLNRLFLYAAARSMRTGRQIQAVVDALEAAGIPSVLLKGPALARTVYPDPALRQSVDIDLLVRPGDVLAAEGVLEGLGYHCSEKGFLVSQHQYNHDIFEPPGEGMHIELHWALDYAFDLFPQDWVDQVIARRVPVSAADLSFHTLGHADHLLFLAYHDVFQHDSIGLDWITDTAGLIGALSDPAEWKDIIEQAVRYHLRIPLELLTNAVALWTGGIKPGDDGSLSAWPSPLECETQLWQHARTRHASLPSYLFLVIRGQPGITEKIRYGFRFILPPMLMIGSYRRSTSLLDIPVAHLRRWARIVEYSRRDR